MKTYNVIFISVVLFVMVFTVTSNILVDTYKVFDVVQWNIKNIDDNMRFRKVNYLNKHPDFNAFILGSSRINKMDAELASKLTGYKYYSFAVGAENLYGIESKIKWLNETRKEVKQIIIGLEYDVMFICKDIPQDALIAKEHPEVSKKSYLDFYFPYLFGFRMKVWRRAFKKRNEPIYYEIDLSSGHWTYPNNDQLINKDHEQYVENHFKYDLACDESKEDVNAKLNHLRDIIEYTKQKNIDTIVVINPFHEYIYNSFDQEKYAYWKDQVTKISGKVWDFSGLNSVTQNNYLYYETSHYTSEVGDMMLNRLFAEGKNTPKDFGQLLSAQKKPFISNQ